ncbi:hypothetical protein QQ045_011512 [Rhodiola kirilowii]
MDISTPIKDGIYLMLEELEDESIWIQLKRFKNALESARKAVELSPNSIEFAFYHAKLLCDLFSDAPQFEQVRHECKKTLGVDNPIDPANEILLDESQYKISTPEQRIANIHYELIPDEPVHSISCCSSSISSTMIDSNPALPDPSILASYVILEYLEELPTNDSELEAEEKLQETLDYQRRVEYEAKQKHLAERYKKTTISFPRKLQVPFDTFSHDSDHDLEKHINLIGQELGCQRNGFKDNDSGLHVLSMDGTAPVDAYTASRSHKIELITVTTVQI